MKLSLSFDDADAGPTPYASGDTPSQSETPDADMFKSNRNTDRHTIVDMSLRTMRYAVVVTIALVAAFSFAWATNDKLQLTRLEKTSGMSTQDFASLVTDKVSFYNTLFGGLMFAGSKVFEAYLDALVFPTLHTYLNNCSLYPGDQPHRVHSKVKARAIFWGLKTVIILMNVGFASLFVSSRVISVAGTSSGDRRLSAVQVEDAFFVPPTRSVQWGVRHDVAQQSLLKTAIEGYTTPFELVNECSEMTAAEHTDIEVNDVDTTSMTLGYRSRDWNEALDLDQASPKTSLSFTYGQFKQNPSLYVYHAKDLALANELLVQGSRVLEHGSQSQAKHQPTMKEFVSQTVGSVAAALHCDAQDLIEISLESFVPSEEIEFTSLTVSVPVGTVEPLCGAKSCVYETKSESSSSALRQQVSVTKYQSVFCDSEDCALDDQAVFLYGVGRYAINQATNSSASSLREYVALSFGKLAWRLSPLHLKHEATCLAEDCWGLSLPLISRHSALLIGRDALAAGHEQSSLETPLKLVQLNSISLPARNGARAWNRATGVAPSLGSQCFPLVDSYVAHVNANGFALERPVSTMYSAGLSYLLQNGVEVACVDSVSRRTLALADSSDSSQKIIKLSISLTSSVATFAGCLAMVLLMICVIVFPTARVKLSPDTTPAAQYVQILTDDLYPDVVHKKRLRFQNGDALMFNEYIIDSLVLHAKRDHSKKIFL